MCQLGRSAPLCSSGAIVPFSPSVPYLAYYSHTPTSLALSHHLSARPPLRQVPRVRRLPHVHRHPPHPSHEATRNHPRHHHQRRRRTRAQEPRRHRRRPRGPCGAWKLGESPRQVFSRAELVLRLFLELGKPGSGDEGLIGAWARGRKGRGGEGDGRRSPFALLLTPHAPRSCSVGNYPSSSSPALCIFEAGRGSRVAWKASDWVDDRFSSLFARDGLGPVVAFPASFHGNSPFSWATFQMVGRRGFVRQSLLTLRASGCERA